MRILCLVAFGVAVLSSVPCAGEISVVGGLTRQATVKPGERNEGKLLVRNTGEERVDVRAYARDYMFHADGTNVYGEPGSVPRSNASWLTFTPHQFSIEPGAASAVRYAIDVPDDETLTGTYWSILFVERVDAVDARAEGGPKPEVPQAGIHVVVRYGIQFVTHVGDTGEPALRFLDKRLLTEDARRTLRLDIENTGTRWVNPLVWVELFGEDGLSAGRIQGGRKRIYPGCSARFEMDLSQLPAAKYTALIVADNGDAHVFGSEQLEMELR